ncbi:MAG: hypothetical protein AB7P23_12085, partial [Amphiplicatus sp.]
LVVAALIPEGKATIEGKHLTYSKPLTGRTEHIDLGLVDSVKDLGGLLGKTVTLRGPSTFRKRKIRRINEGDAFISAIYAAKS